MRYVKSDLCQLGWLSCMGCCGHDFKKKIDVARGIEKNTLEFHHHKKSGKHLKEFMNRSQDLRDCGVCRNLIYHLKRDRILCPLHPEENSGEDLRIEHPRCDILHVCKTAFFFDLWEPERKNAFLKFIRDKKKKGELDWFSYSKGMADDSLLNEFEGLAWD